jgi:hypothetical protein
MLNTIEIILQLVNLSIDLPEARYLGICHVDRITGTVILLLRHSRRLLGQIV